MRVLKYLPNTFTSLNLVAGCIGLLSVSNGDMQQGAIFILLGAVFDYLDGFVARLLGISSDLGKQLDSLADLVTFGILPAFLMYSMLEDQGLSHLPYLSLLIVISSAFRLGRFNIDDSQHLVFRGLPTPADAFLIAGIVFAKGADWSIFSFLFDNLPGLVVLVLAVSYLLNAPLSFLSFKVSGYQFKGNEYPIIVIIVSLLFIFIFGLKGILPATLFYIVLSLVRNMLLKWTRS